MVGAVNTMETRPVRVPGGRPFPPQMYTYNHFSTMGILVPRVCVIADIPIAGRASSCRTGYLDPGL